MSHPDLITTSIWDDPKNVEKLIALWMDGKSASQVALAIGNGVTRNSVIGKITRLKLGRHSLARPKGNRGNPGQTKPAVIAKRISDHARQRVDLPHRRPPTFMPPMEIVDEGVDVTHLIGFRDRRIGKECSFIPGDPRDGAMCCGKPVKEGTEWCPEHHARIYPKGATR